MTHNTCLDPEVLNPLLSIGLHSLASRYATKIAPATEWRWGKERHHNPVKAQPDRLSKLQVLALLDAMKVFGMWLPSSRR